MSRWLGSCGPGTEGEEVSDIDKGGFYLFDGTTMEQLDYGTDSDEMFGHQVNLEESGTYAFVVAEKITSNALQVGFLYTLHCYPFTTHQTLEDACATARKALESRWENQGIDRT